MDKSYLIFQAERCIRLSQWISDPDWKGKLELMAKEFLVEAEAKTDVLPVASDDRRGRGAAGPSSRPVVAPAQASLAQGPTGPEDRPRGPLKPPMGLRPVRPVLVTE